uniref:Uncharacterized protein n=1 Tax=Rhizochromulina marina TaxID=1034831 RepID=A0A7S2W6X5_9STRA|mmetsp:Transcript_16226/g.47641  ORF Transcript_16226/g.47641 Transcript_16226/m.47641 type:complete len:169 (+) Transcript_16226:45-551(+)
MRVLALLIAAAVPACMAMQCPGSDAYMHASCRVELTTTASCDAARDEIYARVNGQYDAWHDPHNNGTYAVLSDDGSVLELKRVTGNLKYTDKMDFTFTESGSGCKLTGCSESQVNSIADYSTNYCNLRMLYCNTADGCSPVTQDLGASETSVKPSWGASSDASACLVV